MLTKNLDVSQGLVNGARGVVIGFETEGKGWFLKGILERGFSLFPEKREHCNHLQQLFEK